MKLARMGPVGEEIPVVLDNGNVYDASDLTATYDGEFLRCGGVAAVRTALAGGELPTLDSAGQRMGAPIAIPSKIVCVGLNYIDHARESAMDVPAEPILFMKAPTTIVGPDDPIEMPRGGTKLDWEVELAVVIGRRTLYLESADDARECIAGVAIAHDVSERAFQLERGGQWDKGKSCPTFNPIGPFLDVSDGAVEADRTLTLSVNGTEKQRAATADMIRSPLYLVWYISQFMALEPGDVINTGTPSGVALGEAEPRWLREGDVVELSITGLGTQRQRVVQYDMAH